MAEAGLLNLAVPVGTLGLPLFLANMWLCFAVGWALAGKAGRKRDYLPLPPSPGWKSNMRLLVILPAATVELAIGVAYFSVGNWSYVFTDCLTGNACTFFQLAPVLFLIIGAACLGGLAAIFIRERS